MLQVQPALAHRHTQNTHTALSNTHTHAHTRQHDASRAILSGEFVGRLKEVWDRHDRAKRGYIRLEQLWTFMKEVPLPLGLGPVDGYVKKFLPVLC